MSELAQPDRILIEGLRVLAFCGVLPEEKARRQPFEISAEIETDTSAAGVSDDLADTIDYGALTSGLAELVETGRYDLLEFFAERIAEVLMVDPRATGCTVTVKKLRPPVPEDLAASGVRITRRRG